MEGWPTLGAVLDFEGGLLAFAGAGLVAAGGFDAVHCVDAALGEALGVFEKEPRDSALAAIARAGGSRGIGLVHFGEDGHRVRRLGELIESEDWRSAAEEVMSKEVLEAKGLQVLSEACGQRAQRQCQWGNGGDGPSGEGVILKLRADVVEVG